MTTASTDFAPQGTCASSPLTGHHLTTLRVMLTDGLADHLRNLERNDALATTLKADRDDDVARDHETARLASDLARDAIADIERALGRMDDGTYGTCARCQRPIPFERLEAIPQSRHCVACAARD